MLNLTDIINEHLQSDKPFIAPVKKTVERKGRQPKNPVDWIDVDFRVFKAILHFTFDGCSIAKLIETCPTFVRKDAQGNRRIIKDSLESLRNRGFIKLTGHGRDLWIQGVNGISLASYFPRGETAPPAIVYRRTTVKEETPIETVETHIVQTDESFFDDDDYSDLEDDLSVE